MVSDLRLPGGTTASMAEEIRAQAANGYRTALLHVNSSLTAKALGVSAHLGRLVDDGVADLVLPGDEVHARHAVVRHPAVAQCMTGRLPSVTVDGVSLIANHPVQDAEGVPQYDPLLATEALATCFGHKATWRPIGPVIRRQLSHFGEIEVAGDDWHNLIDARRWAADRQAGVRGVPVLGRHSRPHPSKWPDRAEDILAAYPDSADLRVRVLGGAWPVRRVLGHIPQRWLVEQFGARNPRDFVADLDFFVYFHHSAWVEAFGRNIMEALASGAVAILPEHFRETYGDAAIYAEPAEVRGIVTRLTADRDAYLEQSARGQDYIAARHDYPVHATRLAELVGPPLTTDDAAPAATLPGSPAQAARVLFVSSNGTGMGHLTRLLAMATRSSEQIEPFFFSMSSAVPVVAQYGYTWEYCPSRDDLDVTSKEWNPLFAHRFADIVRRYRPRALVFDGTWPYRGLGEARQHFPELVYTWSRRGMWREGHRTDSLENSSWFDLVIEPGEFAAAADRGPTSTRTDARRVGPVTLLDPADLLSREEAREALGIPADEHALLVTLGGGNVNDVTSDLDAVAETVEQLPGWQVYATRAPIVRAMATAHAAIRTISIYPLARYLAAFDAAVVACGYNAYHESIMAAVPTIFVPKEKVTDDQQARARYAEEAGVGICVDEVTPATMQTALERLLDPAELARMRDRCVALYPENGAAEAMQLIEELLTRKGVIS